MRLTRTIASSAAALLVFAGASTLSSEVSASTHRNAEGSVFTIAVIPDTQDEVFGSDQRFPNRTQWIVDNRNDLNLQYVLHTGDMMNWDTADHSQYKVGSAAMARLDDASIPWMVAIGNHDTGAVCPGGSACPGKSAKVTVRDTTTFNSYFPVSRFPNTDGLFESGKIDNAWSTFSAGGSKWLVMTLELWPRRAVVGWAADVVASHPDYNVIIATHSFLTADGQIDQSHGGYGETSSQYLYDNVVGPNSNVKLVFSGHVGEAGSRVDTRPDGSKVAEFLGTFHSGSTNPLQLLSIDTLSGSVSTRFYAPWDGRTWPQYERTVSGMQWIPADAGAPQVASLRSVANGLFVSTDGGDTKPLIADRAQAGQWERFTIERLGGDDVALRSSVNNLYVCAEAEGTMDLIANRAKIGPWEMYDLIGNPDGTVSFRSHANGRYVTAEASGDQPLIANRTVIGPWEKFALR